MKHFLFIFILICNLHALHAMDDEDAGPCINRTKPSVATAVILNENRLLLIKKRGVPFYSLIEMESFESQVVEKVFAGVIEEIAGLILLGFTKLGEWNEADDLSCSTYHVRTFGIIKPASDIEDIIWVNKRSTSNLKLERRLQTFILPLLESRGLIDVLPPQRLPSLSKRRIFVFDLDGTLIFNSKPLDPLLTENLHRLVANNNLVVFASARAPRGIKSILPDSLSSQTIICCNGSWGGKHGDRNYVSAIPSTSVKRIIAWLKENGLTFQLEFGESFSIVGNKDLFPFLSKYNTAIEFEEECLERLDTIKISVFYEKKFGDFIQFLSLNFPDLTLYPHDNKYLDLMAPGSNKFNALKNLIPELSEYELYAFGNDHNDFELLVNSHHAVVVGDNMSSLRYSDHITFVQPFIPSISEMISRFEKN